MPAPSATITVAGEPRTVVFDFARLVAIEEATGRTIPQVVSEFAAYADGEHGDRFSVATVGRFLEGCLGLPQGGLGEALPLTEFRAAFVGLLPAFIAAVAQLNGADPTTAPAASAV